MLNVCTSQNTSFSVLQKAGVSSNKAGGVQDVFREKMLLQNNITNIRLTDSLILFLFSLSQTWKCALSSCLRKIYLYLRIDLRCLNFSSVFSFHDTFYFYSPTFPKEILHFHVKTCHGSRLSSLSTAFPFNHLRFGLFVGQNKHCETVFLLFTNQTIN